MSITRRTERRPMKVVTIRIYESDLEYLQLAFAAGGYNRAIRNIIARFVRKASGMEQHEELGQELVAAVARDIKQEGE